MINCVKSSPVSSQGSILLHGHKKYKNKSIKLKSKFDFMNILEMMPHGCTLSLKGTLTDERCVPKLLRQYQ